VLHGDVPGGERLRGRGQSRFQQLAVQRGPGVHGLRGGHELPRFAAVDVEQVRQRGFRVLVSAGGERTVAYESGDEVNAVAFQHPV
jgi:hypothetical protein